MLSTTQLTAEAVVEQYRLLHGMLQVIQEVNTVTGIPLCNENTCPTMSAGRYVNNTGPSLHFTMSNMIHAQPHLHLAR
jgi:hypothetical protein